MGKEIGDISITNRQLSYGEIPNLLEIELGDLGSCFEGREEESLTLELGFNKDKERLFFSTDNGETFREIILDRGTVEGVIMRLPDNLLYPNRRC